ncbi:LuxR family transcriptional regulator [Cryptosporangium japonicum]|uniref:LuxR family transcriptional regulator n=2 Tax=Cryptosporangium japonicum TaxID=80872 RepID=A0ABP3DZ52_9ACTN
MLSGPPGIGKSTLLDYAAQAAGAAHVGGDVIRLSGVETETTLPFAALGDLLLPVSEHYPALPHIQRLNLENALAVGDQAQLVNPYAVCNAALTALSVAGQHRPLVILVDDLQWVDPDSERVFQFVARRIADERVVFVAASRIRPEATGSMTILDLDGLSRSDCERLLRARGLALAPSVRAELLEFSQGNPLILLEYADRLTPAQRGGKQRLPAIPEVGDRAEQGWATRLRLLPPKTRHALALLAAAREISLDQLATALSATGCSLHDLTPAVDAHLVISSEYAYEFVHPIVRGVVLSSLLPPARREIYQILAEHATGALRAWYLASASTGPDEDVARSLVAAADEARQCGSYLAAAQAMCRAAELTHSPAQRAARLFRGATDSFLGGACADAADWCEAARRDSTDHRMRADLALLRGRALMWIGLPGQAHRLMRAAAEEVAATDPARAYRLASEAALPAAMNADLHSGMQTLRRSQELLLATDQPAGTSSVFGAVVLTLAGNIAEARRELERAKAGLVGADPRNATMELGLVGQMCTFTEHYDEAQRLLNTALDAARTTTDPTALAFAFGARAELGWWLGHWSPAYADADESLSRSRALRQPGAAAFSLLSLARIDAARGDRSRCTRHIAEAFDFTDITEARHMPIMRDHALGLDGLGHGASKDAAAYLDQAFSAFDHFGLGNPNIAPFAADLVEAHIRAGNPVRAREIASWLEDVAKLTGLSWPTAAAARCRALLADDPDVADAAFLDALAEHERHPSSFEHARTLLCRGEVLRRARRKAQARTPLLTAHGMFTTLGAKPWIDRCRSELAASGHQPVDEQPDERLHQLTPQELQVARLVAQGLTNIEIGSALFVSPKTVEAYLTRSYRKLGIPSRSALARAVAASGRTDRG